MPCDTVVNKDAESKRRMQDALKRLDGALMSGTVQAVIGPQGSIAFRGWQDRGGLSDLCAYRKLAAGGSMGLRRAIARAEVVAGRGVDQRAVAAGHHSHDGGSTWGTH